MHQERLRWHALVWLAGLLLLGLTVTVPGKSQLSAPAPGGAENALERVIGQVTATNPAASQITLKTDAGGTVLVILQDKTLYLRVPPGETDLKKAVKITPADIGVGDRVYARGRLAEDQKSIPAVAVIVMTKADLAQKRERERAEWQKRGVAGTISALNPETKEIRISIRSREGTKSLVIEPSQNAVFRRYAPDSVRFGEAKPSSLAELKVGDALRLLGEGSSDGTRMKAEEIVSGSFRNIAGIVTAINAATGEIRITDLQTTRPLTVRITSDTVVRRLPPTKAAPTTTRPQGGGSGTPAAGSAGSGSGGRPSEGPTQGAASAPATNRPQAGGTATATAGTPRSAGRPGDGAAQGAPQMDLERMPVLPFGELKRDQAIIVLCTVGAEASRVTAIVVVAGVEPLLAAAPEQTPIGGVWNFFDNSLP